MTLKMIGSVIVTARKSVAMTARIMVAVASLASRAGHTRLICLTCLTLPYIALPELTGSTKAADTGSSSST